MVESNFGQGKREENSRNTLPDSISSTTKPTWSGRESNSGLQRWEASDYSLAPRNQLLYLQAILMLFGLTAIQEVPDPILDYTLEIYLKYRVCIGVHPASVWTNGQLCDLKNSEILLRKLKLWLRANHKASCTVIWLQPLHLFQSLRGCSATDLIFN